MSSERRGIVTLEELQTRVQDAVDERIDSGTELGAQVAVIHGGGLVVNVASGLADLSGRVVQPDTLFWAASTAKGVASTVAHVLAELGVLDNDMPLAAEWPEFAQHGKDTPNPPEPGSAQAPAAVAPTADLANRPDVLRADIPSTGTMTAAGAARMCAALLGHVDGTALVAPDRLRTIADVVYTGADVVMGVPHSGPSGTTPIVPPPRPPERAPPSAWSAPTDRPPSLTSSLALRSPS